MYKYRDRLFFCFISWQKNKKYKMIKKEKSCKENLFVLLYSLFSLQKK